MPYDPAESEWVAEVNAAELEPNTYCHDEENYGERNNLFLIALGTVLRGGA